MSRRRARKTKSETFAPLGNLGRAAARWRHGLEEYLEDEAFDRRLDQSVDFLRAHGFGGEQLGHLFRLESRRQKFMYIASVTGFTLAVTLFSKSLVGRSLRRVPLLSWG